MSNQTKHWLFKKIKDVNERKASSIDPSKYPEETFELFSVPIFPTGMAEIVQGKDIGSTKQIVKRGDVLLCKINPRINRVWVVSESKGFRQIASSEWIVVRSPMHNDRFLKYFFQEGTFRDLLCSDVSGVGGSLTRAKPKLVNEYEVVVAPLAEQKRIVEKLDEVLTQVDTIKARLDGIPALLKRFRQSVLASAVSGKLTDCEVPRQITCLKNLGKISGGKTPSKANSAFWNGDILWVSPKDMKSDYIEDSLDHISDLAMSQGGMKYVPKNSLLMVTRSGILAHTFPVALTTKKITINQDIKAFTPDCSLLLPQFGLYLIKGLAPRILAECSKTGTTVASVETKLLESMEFELPSTQEQKEIVRLVDQYFAFADTIEAQVKKAQARVDNLTQSILAKAFRGELVPQDPNDEPADKLLERIAATRKEAEALAKAAKKAEAAKKIAAKKATENS